MTERSRNRVPCARDARPSCSQRSGRAMPPASKDARRVPGSCAARAWKSSAANALAVLGARGAGTTTLLYCLAGVEAARRRNGRDRPGSAAGGSRAAPRPPSTRRPAAPHRRPAASASRRRPTAVRSRAERLSVDLDHRDSRAGARTTTSPTGCCCSIRAVSTRSTVSRAPVESPSPSPPYAARRRAPAHPRYLRYACTSTSWNCPFVIGVYTCADVS